MHKQHAELISNYTLPSYIFNSRDYEQSSAQGTHARSSAKPGVLDFHSHKTADVCVCFSVLLWFGMFFLPPLKQNAVFSFNGCPTTLVADHIGV